MWLFKVTKAIFIAALYLLKTHPLSIFMHRIKTVRGGIVLKKEWHYDHVRACLIWMKIGLTLIASISKRCNDHLVLAVLLNWYVALNI